MADDTSTTDASATGADDTNTSDATLGDAGKQALDRMKAERDAARAEARSAKALQKQLDDLKAATATDAEKALADAKTEGRTEALSVANDRVLKAETKALAAGILAQPSLAPKLLDLSEFSVDDDGNVDEKAIKKALKALVEEYPNLATTEGTRTPRVPTGARGGSQPSGMNAAIAGAFGRR